MLKKLFTSIAVFILLAMAGSLVLSPEKVKPYIERFKNTIANTADKALPIEIVPTLPVIKKDLAALGIKKKNEELSVDDVIDATNKERVKAGLMPLSTNPKLLATATSKNADMITYQYFEHTSPSGKTVSDLGREAKYDYVVMGENLALGNFDSAEELLNAWMNSPGHRANILNENYQEIGVSVIKDTYQGKEVWFAVQHFGTTRGVCPIIDTMLKRRIDVTANELKVKESQITVLRKGLESPDRPAGSEYQSLLNEFNQLIGEYNTLLKASQVDISKYNVQVNSFNRCLAQYQ